MSLEKIRTYDLEERFIAVMSRIKSPYMVDQDILNVIFEGDVHFLDGAWNYEYHLPIWSPDYADQLPFETLAVYQKSRENAKIVHFAGSKSRGVILSMTWPAGFGNMPAGRLLRRNPVSQSFNAASERSKRNQRKKSVMWTIIC